jgi:hypothetical protein
LLQKKTRKKEKHNKRRHKQQSMSASKETRVPNYEMIDKRKRQPPQQRAHAQTNVKAKQTMNQSAQQS